MKKLIGLVVILIFVGCGYKPSSYYTKRVLGQNIYAQVKISRTDPRNSVIIKDAINEAILTRFLGRLTTKEKADTVLNIKFNSVSFKPVLYDASGYVVSYKSKVSLKISYKRKGKVVKILSTSGEYDFPIEANSVISDTKRFEAIRYASLDAINEFVSAVSVQGMKK